MSVLSHYKKEIEDFTNWLNKKSGKNKVQRPILNLVRRSKSQMKILKRLKKR